MNTNEINMQKKLYIILLFISLMVLILVLSTNNIDSISILLVLFLVGTSLIIIGTMYRKYKLLITPITVFSIIWCIILPLTSFSYPMMEAMSKFQWVYSLLGIVLFSIGGLISCGYASKYLRDKTMLQDEWKMTISLYKICMFIIIVSILLYGIQAILSGGFPAFSSNVSYSRDSFYTIPGMPFFTNLGFLGVYLIYCDKNFRKNKIFWIISAIYIFIQILMAVRFILIVFALMLLSTYGINRNKKKQVTKLIIIALMMVLGFSIVASVRGGLEDKQKYFIDTGLYSGTAQELVNTEIIRYFGMSQRMMEDYMTHYEGGCSKMGHTLYPILDIFGIEPYMPDHYGQYGYTACNIITYFYFDAGDLWWILMIIWSYITNIWYFAYKHKPNDILSKYLWSLSLISIGLSFFCYINSYSYWCLYFILVLLLLKRWHFNFVFRPKNFGGR